MRHRPVELAGRADVAIREESAAALGDYASVPIAFEVRERLAVETRNVNVPACRFHAREGFVLGAVDRFAYPELPDATRLVWHERLGAGDAPNGP